MHSATNQPPCLTNSEASYKPGSDLFDARRLRHKRNLLPVSHLILFEVAVIINPLFRVYGFVF